MLFKAIAGSAVMICVVSSPVLAADCGPLKLLNEVHFVSSNAGLRPMLPVTVNGSPKLFLIDTGGYASQLTPDVVRDLQMPTQSSALRLYNASGSEAAKFAVAETFKFGVMSGQDRPFMVGSIGSGDLDGIFAADFMINYDVDIDFGADKLRFFSSDHCPGNVVYWNPPTVAAVPIRMENRFHITVPVKLDGVELTALIDTGATKTITSLETAKREFGVTPSSQDVTKGGTVNGDPNLASYQRTFQRLSFEGVDVTNLKVLFMPDRAGSGNRDMQTGNRALRVTADVKMPELILGMDVLRHLHVYMAFKERRFYVSAGSPRNLQNDIGNLDLAISYSPNNAALRNSRCFERGLRKVQLEEALQDCDIALKAKPGSAAIIDSRGLVLYQLGRYQDSLAAYDEALKISPDIAASLFVRGHAKRRLGDAAGGEADINRARAVNPEIATLFKGAQISQD